MGRYLLSVFGAEPRTQFGDHPSREAMLQSFADTGAFNQRLIDSGQFVFADGLTTALDATTVDGRGDTPVITDGPYLESKEHLGGFWVIEAADLDEALRLAADASHACGSAVEVRPFQTEESIARLLEQ